MLYGKSSSFKYKFIFHKKVIYHKEEEIKTNLFTWNNSNNFQSLEEKKKIHRLIKFFTYKNKHSNNDMRNLTIYNVSIK